MAKPSDDKEVRQLKKRVHELEKELEVAQETEPKRSFNWRPTVVLVSIVLSALFFTSGALTLAVNHTINNTDTYMRTVGPIIKQPEVQAAVVKKSEEAIKQNINIDQIVSDALPPKASFLAGPITDQINSHIHTFLSNAVASDQFYKIWYNTNRKVHDSTIEFVKQSDGDPNLNVSDIYKYLSSQLQDTPLSVVANKQLPAKVGNIHVTNVAWLPEAHRFLADLPIIEGVSFLLAIGFGALAVLLANKRARAGMSIALTITGLMLLVALAIAISKSYALADIKDPVYNAAAGAIWDTVLTPLHGYIATLVTLGVLTSIITWVAGGSRPAMKLKRGFNTSASKVHNFIIRGHDKNAFFKHLRSYKTGLEWLILIITVSLFLFVFRPLSVSVVLTTSAISLLIAALLEILAAK